MIATVVFIIAFVVIALAVFFVAMSGGRGSHGKEAKSAAEKPATGGHRALSVGLTVVIVAIGLAVPALVVAYNTNTQSKKAPGGLTLNADEQNGRQVFAQNCATCHTLAAANAVGKVGPNLDVLRPPAALVVNAVKMGRAQGNGSMPAQLVSGQDLKDVAAFVGATAGHGVTPTTTAAPAASAPATAAPAAAGAAKGGATAAIDAKKLFVEGNGQGTACGACHTLAVAGTTGTTGPNLNKFIEAGDDEAAIKEMIVKPNAEIAKGYQASIMPQNYGTTLTAAEITALAKYIYDGTHGKNAAP